MARTTTGEGKAPTQADGDAQTKPGQQGTHTGAFSPGGGTGSTSPSTGPVGAGAETQGKAYAPAGTELERRAAEADSREARLKEMADALEERARAFEETMSRFQERMQRHSRSLDEREESLDAKLRTVTPREVVVPEEPVKKDSGPTTLVINQRPSPVTIYASGGPVPTAVHLKPGGNEVPSGAWDAAKQHPHVQTLLALGQDPRGEDGLRELDGSSTREISNVGEALMLVRSLTSSADLERVTAGEQRAQVKDAAEKQKKKVAEAEARARG